MNFNAYSSNSIKVDDAVTCGKILLHKNDWEIIFNCDYCQKNLPTLSELLRHTLNEHIENVPKDKLQSLCGIKTEGEIDAKPGECCEASQATSSDQIKQEETQEEQIEAIVEFDEDALRMDHDVDGDTNVSFEKEDNGNNNEVEASNAQFEFLDVDDKKKETKRKGKSTKVDPKEPRKLTCPICSAAFTNRQELTRHKRAHGEKPFICTECGVGFAENRNLKMHGYRHLGIKPHSCTVCEKAFTTATEVKIHMRIHTGERPYKCDQCEMTFTNSSTLISHQRRHTNERPYLCPACGKSFYDSNQLIEHMSVHSSERPFKCTQCNASFGNRKSLRQHVLLHSDVKKYNCEFCGKAFAQAAGIYLHLKSMHKNEKKVKK